MVELTELFVVEGSVLPSVEIGLVDSVVGGVGTLPTTLPANLIVRIFGAATAPPATASAAPPATRPRRAKSRLVTPSSLFGHSDDSDKISSAEGIVPCCLDHGYGLKRLCHSLFSCNALAVAGVHY